jgi:hypothetical protein
MWLHMQLLAASNRASLNSGDRLTLRGPLSRDAVRMLRSAVQHLVATHEILRTHFPRDAGGKPVARIYAPAIDAASVSKFVSVEVLQPRTASEAKRCVAAARTRSDVTSA